MKTNIPEFKATSACAKCKGCCCKHMGCHFAPSDFEQITFESLKNEIEKGYISIDWWEAWEPQYYLRTRHKEAPIVDPSWGGVCVLLTKEGCSLPFDKRPLGARALEPRVGNGGCVGHYTKEMCKNDWLAYHDILIKLVEYFLGKETKTDEQQ